MFETIGYLILGVVIGGAALFAWVSMRGRKEAAAAISVSVETLGRLVKRRLIRPSRATRRPLFPVAELQRFLRDTRTDI